MTKPQNNLNKIIVCIKEPNYKGDFSNEALLFGSFCNYHDMDFNRAQKNFDNFVANNDELDVNTYSSPTKDDSQASENDFGGTQVPEMAFSDDDIEVTSEKSLAINSKTSNSTGDENDDEDDEVIVTQERKIEVIPTAIIDLDDDRTNKDNDDIFINTQIQSRLDEHEKESSNKNVLKSFNFEYVSEDSIPHFRNLTNEKSKKSSQQRKRVTKQGTTTDKITRAETLLKLLSGKNSKVKSIINRYQNKTKKPNKVENILEETQSTYNSQEWEQVKDLLRSRYTNLKDDQDFENVIEELSFEMVDNGDLWSTSQAVMKTNTPEIVNDGAIGSLQTLSQVLDDQLSSQTSTQVAPIPHPSNMVDSDVDNLTNDHQKISVENTKLEDKDDTSETDMLTQETQETIISPNELIDDEMNLNGNSCLNESRLFTIYQRSNPEEAEIIKSFDSSDEYESIITFNENKLKELYRQQQKLKSFNENGHTFARPSLRKKIDSIVDLSQSSFKAVNSLISPLKSDAKTPEDKKDENITATERSQPVKKLNLNEIPNITYDMNKKKECIYQFKLKEEALKSLEKSIKNNARVDINSKTTVIDYSSPSSDENNNKPTYMVQVSINDNVELLSSPTNNTASQLGSQNLTELRQKLNIIGLKPARLKSQIVSSLEAASQVQTQEKLGISNKYDTYGHLTKLVEQDSELLTRIYCFQPISMNELISRLKEQDSFVDFIDENTFREWADMQGICIRSNT